MEFIGSDRYREGRKKEREMARALSEMIGLCFVHLIDFLKRSRHHLFALIPP